MKERLWTHVGWVDYVGPKTKENDNIYTIEVTVKIENYVLTYNIILCDLRDLESSSMQSHRTHEDGAVLKVRYRAFG